MPDPNRQTISASQTAALWNASPYMTKWMLWQYFKQGLAEDVPETSRMKWGKLLEPIVLDEVARQHKLNLKHNVHQKYVRNGLLGATRDADIEVPGKGAGVVEVKCVFDYPTWMSEWQGGRSVPRHIEIQLQTQMMVGDGTRSYDWGMIVAWVCANTELVYFERRPVISLWTQLSIEADRFFGSIERDEEPDAFGAPIEIPWATSLNVTEKNRVLDLSSRWEHVELANELSIYNTFKNEKTQRDKVLEGMRAKFLVLAHEAEQVILPCGASYRVRKSGGGKTIIPFIPEVPTAPPAPPESVFNAG